MDLQRRKVKLVYEIVSALILIPIIKNGTSFYITLFILLMNKSIDVSFNTNNGIGIIAIWKIINQWMGIIDSAIAFSLVYPGFAEYVYSLVDSRWVIGFLLIGVYSHVFLSLIETVWMDVKRNKMIRELRAQKEKYLT